jgi:2-methylisocitrate lyase-like PEP mutase family enzyme
MPSARQQLRAMLQRGETIAAPGAYDPLSARVVQSLGEGVQLSVSLNF